MRSAQPGMVSATTVKRRAFSKPTKTSQASTAEVEVEEGAAFLGALSDGSSSSWRSTVSLNNKAVDFKLDTGAEVTAVSEETYKQVYGKQLQRPMGVSCGPSYQSLKVQGTAYCQGSVPTRRPFSL